MLTVLVDFALLAGVSDTERICRVELTIRVVHASHTGSSISIAIWVFAIVLAKLI